jgi:hypothetical protein
MLSVMGIQYFPLMLTSTAPLGSLDCGQGSLLLQLSLDGESSMKWCSWCRPLQVPVVEDQLTKTTKNVLYIQYFREGDHDDSGTSYSFQEWQRIQDTVFALHILTMYIASYTFKMMIMECIIRQRSIRAERENRWRTHLKFKRQPTPWVIPPWMLEESAENGLFVWTWYQTNKRRQIRSWPPNVH